MPPGLSLPNFTTILVGCWQNGKPGNVMLKSLKVPSWFEKWNALSWLANWWQHPVCHKARDWRFNTFEFFLKTRIFQLCSLPTPCTKIGFQMVLQICLINFMRIWLVSWSVVFFKIKYWILAPFLVALYDLWVEKSTRGQRPRKSAHCEAGWCFVFNHTGIFIWFPFFPLAAL